MGRDAPLTADRIAAALDRLSATLPAGGRIWVAYSGGLDSHVLLHALASNGPPGLHALHIDHALHPDSPAWAGHCAQVCEHLGVPLTTRRVEARAAMGESPEAAAREARYAAFRSVLETHDRLLTAQHRDDQLETVLLQLMRGAGPKGLAGMSPSAALGGGFLLRPLLDIARTGILGYAERHGLRWLEDPSNNDVRFDRNYLRHEVVPRLLSRWPGAARTVTRSARLAAFAANAIEREAAADLAALKAVSRLPAALPIASLLALGEERAREVLRRWLADAGLSSPSEIRIKRIVGELLLARADANPLVELDGVSLRRFRDHVHLVPALPAVGAWTLAWENPTVSLDLPAGLGGLRWQDAPTSHGLRVAPRRGGERFSNGSSRPRRAVKDVLREAGVVPWLRPLMPLVRNSAGDVIAVPGITPGLRWIRPDGQPW